MTASDKILAYLRSLERPVSPSEIARITEISPNTVRPTLSRLVRSGKAARPYRGHYCTVEGPGASIPLPRVHGLSVLGEPVFKREVLPEPEWRLEIPGPTGTEADVTRIRILWGSTHNRIHWTLKSSRGLDQVGLALVRRLVECEVARHGYQVREWIVRQMGLNNDYLEVELAGSKSITLRDLQGNLERIYQKAHGVRREVHLAQSTSLDELMMALQGGLPSYNLAQSNVLLATRIQEFMEGQKYVNALMVKILDGQGALQEALLRLIDRLGEGG